MPFGHVYNYWFEEDDCYPNERRLDMNFNLRSGPGYSLSASPVTQKVEAEVHNASEREPAINTGLIASSSVALIGGVVRIFAPNLLSQDMWELIFYIVALIIPIVTAVRIRGKVWSPASVKEVLDISIAEAEKIRHRSK